ncbi:MAG: hypothetical protein Q4A04_01360 [Eubacteriales bacterium]|nr:hypothetical protein [Eubacteriales bacterium]
MKADLVVYGKIFTAEKDNDGLCEAFAVKDGKYVYAGDRNTEISSGHPKS